MKYIFVLVDMKTGETLVSKAEDRTVLNALLFPKKAQVEVPQKYICRITRLFEMSLLDFRGRRADSTYELFERSLCRLTDSNFKFLDEPSDVEVKAKLQELFTMGQKFPAGVWEIQF
jgi:hypothetical protein